MGIQARQVIVVEASSDYAGLYCAYATLLTAFTEDPSHAVYAACPALYGSTEEEAAGKVKEWLVNSGADISRLEVCIH